MRETAEAYLGKPVSEAVVTVTTTNASGVATFTNLSVLGAVGANALVFSAGG